MAIGRPSRWMTLAGMAIAGAATFGFYVREQSSFVLAVLLQEAIYQLMYLLPAVLLGRVLVRRLARDQANTTFGVVSACALGLGLMGFATFGLSVSGLLNEVSAWIILVGALAVGLIDAGELATSLSGSRAKLSLWLKAPSEGGLAVGFRGAIVRDSGGRHHVAPRHALAAGRPASLRLAGLPPADPRANGMSWGAMQPLKHNVYSFFPFNVELHYLLANYLRGGPYIAMQQNQCFSISCTLLAGRGDLGLAQAAGGGHGRRHRRHHHPDATLGC